LDAPRLQGVHEGVSIITLVTHHGFRWKRADQAFRLPDIGLLSAGENEAQRIA
jgi:hypothetical protein